MLYGIGMPKVNNKVVADMYGVSIERVRQLKELALERLRKRYGNKLKNLF
jgi:DNA-directed RNA polymerase sigma subunit (sigma70/sigma32)